MNLEQYQKFCRTTDLVPYGPDNGVVSLLAYRSLCVSGEVGELSAKILNLAFAGLALSAAQGGLANLTKKIKRDDQNWLTPGMRHDMVSELGDIMWYTSILCDLLDVPLRHVLDKNVENLSRRKEEDKIKGSGDDR